MKARVLSLTGALLGASLLSGCKVGPNYKAPAMPAPPAYTDDGHNGDWSTAKPADGVDRGLWWSIYQDDELNNLEQRCAAANQNIAAALHAYEQAHDLVRENKSSLYPTVSLGGSASRNRASNNAPLRPSNVASSYWDFLIPLNISWEPDLWGGIRRQIESSAANAQATSADLANTRLSLQGLLAVTFFQLRGLDLQAQLLRSTLDAYTETLQLTEDRLTGGLSSDSDVQQAKAQLEETRAQLIDLGVQREQFEHAIAVLVGESATGFHIAERPIAGDPPSIPTGVPSELLERRPDIAAAERRVASANALIGVAKSAYYPTILLGAGAGVQSSTISNLFNSSSTQWSAGPSASEVLFDAGRRRAQMDFAVAQRKQATALYREQVLSAFRDVEDQLSALRVLEQEASVQDKAVSAAQKSTELSTLRYKRGLAPYLEVLTNQTIELTDERAAASLVARRIVASTQLQMALGGGWNSVQLPPN
ncbi:efflux transporter outer membrane subunit [Tunturibacter empetritectus]|uniref:NodT family efflux transporter outer membrane factor (OMF) lipoprotein n=1 Tax=Tunturiibacter empetritectus TaxID=3069691 RepID=A0A7W8ILA4_9BACT|nr:efflux transporter outer membrane subunit [Edaphobacter lichenicola]MBB5319219.1 NodT family efflux transporter outer membrane factor (OMF) lipoprotein [Edaphobacter lichenicola]